MEPVKDICMKGSSQGKRCGWIQSWNLFSNFDSLFSLSRSTFQYPENWGTLKEIMAVLKNVMSKIANTVNSCRKVTLAEIDFSLGPFQKKNPQFFYQFFNFGQFLVVCFSFQNQTATPWGFLMNKGKILRSVWHSAFLAVQDSSISYIVGRSQLTIRA